MIKFCQLVVLLSVLQACSQNPVQSISLPAALADGDTLAFRPVQTAEPISLTLTPGDETAIPKSENLFTVNFKENNSRAINLRIRGSWNACNNFLSYQIMSRNDEFFDYDEFEDTQPLVSPHKLSLAYLYKKEGKHVYQISVNGQDQLVETQRKIHSLELEAHSPFSLDTSNLKFAGAGTRQ